MDADLAHQHLKGKHKSVTDPETMTSYFNITCLHSNITLSGNISRFVSVEIALLKFPLGLAYILTYNAYITITFGVFVTLGL